MAIISNDFLITDDIVIKDGDIFVGVSDDQNSQHIIHANKGDFRQFPLLGVGIINYVNSPILNTRSLERAIREEHARDGYRVDQYEIQNFNDEATINVRAIKERR